MSLETRNCSICEVSFDITEDDFTFYERIGVSIPKKCPLCRQKQRMSHRNFKTLYKRPSSKSGKPIVSMYSEKAEFPVWSRAEWWADDWDAKGFGINIDFSQPFFEQLEKLWKKVPRFSIHNVKSENCEYSNLAFESNNCYLIFGCVSDENCSYGHIVWNSKDCFDGLYVYKSELCYECTDVLGSYKVLYSQECEDCNNSIGLYDCKGCGNCIGCVGLQQKFYYVFNENVGKEGYEQFIKDHPLSDPKTIELILQKQGELRKQVPQRHFFGSQNNDVSGNHVYNSKNMHHAFDVKGGENSKYVFTARKIVDVYDLSFSPDVELGYEVLAGAGRGIYFSHNCNICTDIYCSNDCFSCHNVFGCNGLRSSEYCILNKQYSKEEYEDLKEKLIEHMKTSGEWGEFFPSSMSAFAYNESIINEYHPLSKEKALEQGYCWEDDIPVTSGQETITYDNLPKNPEKYSQDLVKEVLACSECKKNYKLIPMEIDFYKSNGLSLPDKCFNCRHQKRMDSRNSRVLYQGKCSKCNAEIETSYSEDKQREFKIYCDKCYKEVMV